MKRYFSSFMGMKESENGEWVEYPIFKLLQEKCLANDDLAKSRLETIQERNEEIIILKQELDIVHQTCEDLQDAKVKLTFAQEEVKELKERLFHRSDDFYDMANIKDTLVNLLTFSAILNLMLVGLYIKQLLGY
jgi:hypothetical protein